MLITSGRSLLCSAIRYNRSTRAARSSVRPMATTANAAADGVAAQLRLGVKASLTSDPEAVLQSVRELVKQTQASFLIPSTACSWQPGVPGPVTDAYSCCSSTLEEVHAAMEQQLGGKHDSTRRVQAILASSLYNAGHWQRAFSLMHSVYKLQLELDTTEASELLAQVSSRLGPIACAAGEHQIGFSAALLALDYFSEHSGDGSQLDMLLVKEGIAAAGDGLSFTGRAVSNSAQALQLSMALVGPSHPRTINIMFNHALSLLRDDQPGAAEPLWQQLVDRCRQSYGMESADTQTAFAGLAESKGMLDQPPRSSAPNPLSLHASMKWRLPLLPVLL
ncbi:hypothetical protein V8C86DRAFT_2559263 [Haematococcus lacustris]